MNNNPLANKITSALSESVSDCGSVAIETISFRPSAEVAAMIAALNEVLGLTVSTMFLDAISADDSHQPPDRSGRAAR